MLTSGCNSQLSVGKEKMLKLLSNMKLSENFYTSFQSTSLSDSDLPNQGKENSVA
jgi:hypothetical protein